MYACMRNLLELFYTEREITVTSTDPQFVTPAVKAMYAEKKKSTDARMAYTRSWSNRETCSGSYNSEEFFVAMQRRH